MLRSVAYCGACAAVLALICAGPAGAARVTVHFMPADSRGNTSPSGQTTVSTRTAFFAAPQAPAEVPIRPNQVVTFRHPATGRNINVPLALPEGTPKMRYRTNRVMYDYGSDTIEVRFLNDGSVDVIYNSGFLRRW
jgi:hypothetical protein